jgi:NitT/TauT family transport system substrate-binding protein
VTRNSHSRFSISRRGLIAGAAASSAAAAAGSFPRPAIAQSKTVNFTLSWLPTGQYAFVYMARQLGFWKNRGLEVDITRGYGSMAAVQGIATGKFDFGGAATGAVILGNARGLDLKIVGTQGYDGGLCILVPANSPIKTPKDLAGKKIGVTAAGGDTPFLPAYCKLAGVDYDSISVVSLDSQIIEQSVINGLVDCMIAFAMSSIPNFVTQNFPVRLLRFSDYGLNFYWVNTLVSADVMAKDPKRVAAVQAGLMEGMKWSMLNPEETVERHLKEHSELAATKNGKLFTELGVGMVAAINVAPETEAHGLGYTDVAKIDDQTKLVQTSILKPADPQPKAAASYVVNIPESMVTLTLAEWKSVREKAAKYSQMLGRTA